MALIFATTSCRDDTFSDFADDGSDVYTVTINVGLEGMETSTRDGDSDRDVDSDPPASPAMRYIGDGSKIDMLVYAVYYDAAPGKDEPDHKPDWQAATEYAKGVVKKFEDHEVQAGHGQTILDVSKTIQKGNGNKQPITLTLKKGEKYQVVFWAQNHNTEAFVIDDLKRVQMKYKVLHDEDGKDNILSVNNDEYRDAFCRSISLDGNEANKDITIYLRRPLAQINVGTRGFDYESITRNTHKSGEYLYSKIRINKAARYLNVVTDEIYTTTTEEKESLESPEAFYTIDYEYNKFPAFWRMDVKEEGDYDHTPYPSYSIYDLNDTVSFNAFVNNHIEDFFNGETDSVKQRKFFEEVYGKEEFLKVHLFEHTQEEIDKFGGEKKEDNFYIPYEGMGVALNVNEDKQNRSEEFKYLSMCYILTNSGDDYQDVLTNVKMWIAKDKNGKDEVEVINLNNVPVKRNHRTNIVGSLLTAKANMQIIVDQDFAGRKIHGDDNLLSGELAEGFYYDAEKNEFQISSVNGLLFFQQLVNGDLTVRQVSPNNKVLPGSVGSPYPYYDPNSNASNPPTLYLKYKSWTRSELGDDKANIIIKGSGYDKLANNDYTETVSNKTWTFKVDPTNNNGYWPTYNNFPFYGATVKLMADIDLEGIEWIPIGFDCANWDTTFSNYNSKYNGYYKNNGVTINYIALTNPDDEVNEILLGNRRAFCGTFDGNGHTIYNLTTKKFGANVHLMALQDYDKDGTGNKGGPYDNVQWFEKGFFGVCGPGVVIKNLRLQEVDIQGNNGAGAIAGQVSSLGFPAKIINCVVDRGTIDAVPIYRGDYTSQNLHGRTSARGCYIGGIVGQFCAKDDENKGEEGISEITGCEVRNLTIQGYRRVGGIVGSIADQGSKGMATPNIQLDIKVEKNSFANSTIVVNQYRAFNVFWDYFGTETNNSGVWMNGFGWGSGASYTPMSDYIIGGYYHTEAELATAGDDVNAFDDTKYTGKYYKKSIKNKDAYYAYVNGNNPVSNPQYTEIAVSPDGDNAINIKAASRKASCRNSVIKNVPMRFIPVFTSIFTDNVTLENNYYGETKLHTQLKFYDSPIWVNYEGKYTGKTSSFSIPINFPNKYEIEAIESSPFTGFYAESVTINGSEAPGGASVITPIGVDKPNSSVIYITARDRKQFKANKPKAQSDDRPQVASSDAIGDKYKKPTKISNVVLRGSPYAWAGIILAPNENMDTVNLENVTIYDVYRTLSLQEVDNKGQIQNYTNWTDASVVLNVKNSNLRGYTVPGGGWNQIKYNKTTFEQGSETRYSYDTMGDEHRNEYKTCDVEATTEFTDCFFKAPYYINLRPLRNNKSGGTVIFNNCYATSAYNNVEIKLPSDKEDLVYYIAIEKDTERGQTIVKYYGADQKEIK